MKYIKKFQNKSDFETFKESSEYVTPNLSLIPDANHFDTKYKARRNMKFKVQDKEYNVADGMTWEEWVGHDNHVHYNNDFYSFENGSVVNKESLNVYKNYPNLEKYNNKIISDDYIVERNSETKIFYTTNDGNIISTMDSSYFDGASVVSNVYENGVGCMTFDRPVITLREKPFRGSKLTSLIIPETVINIIGNPFYDSCTNLVKIQSNSPYFTVIDDKILIDNKEKKIIGAAIKSLTGELKIPEYITSIGDYAFSNCNGLTGKLIIPDSVISIGSYAFYRCKNITSLQLGTGLEKILNNAFSQCTGLTGEIIIPDNVRLLGTDAFYYCQKITSVVLNSKITSIPMRAFSNCSKLANINLPDNLIEIGAQAFYSCSNLTGHLVIPNNVIIIGSNAFFSCTKINKLSLGSQVLIIEESAFKGCSGLSGELVIPDSVNNIGKSAFNECNNLTSIRTSATVTALLDTNSIPTTIPIYVPNNLVNLYKTNWSDYAENIEGLLADITETSVIKYTTTDNNIITPPSIYTVIRNEYNDGIGELEVLGIIKNFGGFKNYSKLQTIEIPNGVINIPDNAFYYCSNLTGELNFPDSVKKIGNRAFYNCNKLTQLNFNDNIIFIDDEAFYYCSKITTPLVLPKNLKEVGWRAFYACKFTGELIIPDSVGYVHPAAFNYATDNITSLTIGSNVYSFNSSSFDRLKNVTQIISNSPYCPTIDNKILTNDYGTNIVETACKSLTGELIIPDGIKSIDVEAFMYCSNLTNIVIPDSVTEIDDGAFQDCTKLTSINMGSGVSKLGNDIFENCTNLSIIVTKSRTAPLLDDYTFRYAPSTGTIIYPVGSDYSTWQNHSYLSNWEFKESIEFKTYYDLQISSAENVASGKETTTTVYWTCGVEGVNTIDGLPVIKQISGTGISNEFPQNLSETETVEREITFEYQGLTATTTITQGPWV